MATFTVGKRSIRLPKGMSQEDAQAATEFFEKNQPFAHHFSKRSILLCKK